MYTGAGIESIRLSSSVGGVCACMVVGDWWTVGATIWAGFSFGSVGVLGVVGAGRASG
jgi:hypothetical protein